MSVNVSSAQFSQPDLTEQIEQVLKETRLDPRCLWLEIVESAVIANTELASSVVSRLKRMGIQLHVDDFGTGYSSLNYLHRFQFDALKIDRAFVSRMLANEEASEIVRTIVALAHNLRMRVVAEGVETAAHLEYLKALKPDYAQGYFFSRPVGHKAAAKLIAAQVEGRYMSVNGEHPPAAPLSAMTALDKPTSHMAS